MLLLADASADLVSVDPMGYALLGAGLILGVAIGFFFGKKAVVPPPTPSWRPVFKGSACGMSSRMTSKWPNSMNWMILSQPPAPLS